MTFNRRLREDLLRIWHEGAGHADMWSSNLFQAEERASTTEMCLVCLWNTSAVDLAGSVVFIMCSLKTSNTSITWELLKNENSWAPPRPETEDEAHSLCFNKISRWFWTRVRDKVIGDEIRQVAEDTFYKGNLTMWGTVRTLTFTLSDWKPLKASDHRSDMIWLVFYKDHSGHYIRNRQ